MSYSITGNTIVLKLKSASPAAYSVSHTAVVAIDISGRVTNENGDPVVVTISVKGTNYAVSTNEQGEFQLSNVDPDAVLVVSAINIHPLEVRVAGKSFLEIQVPSKVAAVEEVVISSGYQTLNRTQLTGSYAALEGKFNTKEGIELVKKQKVVQKKIDDLRWKYIMDHPNSVVAYDQATQYMNGFSLQLNARQLDSLRATIAKGWTGTRKYTVFDSMVENAKKGAIGVKYMDFELITQIGGKAMLSDYVSDKKYVLLEFWASWCGPCRGEIPHLKEVNGQKAENFEIISISLDESDEDWKKAIDEEGMNWVQLSAPQGFESPIAKAYNILGIPFSLLLDRDGKIIASGVRGAWLEEKLEGLE